MNIKKNFKTLTLASFVALMAALPMSTSAHAGAPAAPVARAVVSDHTQGDCYDLYGDIVDTANQAGTVLQNWQNAQTFMAKKFWMNKYEDLKLKYWKLIKIYSAECLSTYPGLPTDVPAFPTAPLT